MKRLIVKKSSSGKLQIKKQSISGDLYFSDVFLLLHMNGANGSTSFLDSSNNNFSITRSGNTQISTTQSKFGGSSAYFNGSSALNIPTSATQFNANQDFTIECWAYLSSYSLRGIIGTFDFGRAVLGVDSSGTLYFSRANVVAVAQSSSGAISLNTWHHIAVARSGSAVRMFINGNLVGSGTDSNAFLEPTQLQVGHFAGEGSWWWDGYLDDFRITKNIARYTSNFTIPNEEFPDNSISLNKKIQIKKSSPSIIIFPSDYIAFWKLDDLTDSSGNDYTLTNTGGVSFVPGLVLDCSEFDGSNYLNTDAGPALGSGDYTVSVWANPSELTGYHQILCWRDFGPSISFSSTGQVDWYYDFATPGPVFMLSSTTNVTISQWWHVVVTRESGNLKLYINGVLEDTGFDTSNFTTTIFRVGTHPLNVERFYGKIDAAGVWTRALTVQEISDLYNNGNGLEP